jgi:hypothetical protein
MVGDPHDPPRTIAEQVGVIRGTGGYGDRHLPMPQPSTTPSPRCLAEFGSWPNSVPRCLAEFGSL